MPSAVNDEVPGVETSRALPADLLPELLRAVPRLVDRTRSQAELLAALAGRLPCIGGLRREPPERATDEFAGGDDTSDVQGDMPDIDVLTLLDGRADDEPPSATTERSDDGTEPSRALTESDLPIQDYDSLAASQVVPRLATLSGDELRKVRAYELAHRGRQTILHRVAQRLGD